MVIIARSTACAIPTKNNDNNNAIFCIYVYIYIAYSLTCARDAQPWCFEYKGTYTSKRRYHVSLYCRQRSSKLQIQRNNPCLSKNIYLAVSIYCLCAF